MEPLHESGGRKAATQKNITEEVRQSPRQPSTESRGGNQNENSFTDLRPPSITSIPTGSWESSGDGSPSRMPRGRADRRKIIDTTTPTLIDEHDVSEDEEEMVSLARERLRREIMTHDDAAMNQTPGGAMFSSEGAATSMRRTPGAIAMQASSRHTSVSATEVTDAALLGFGLTLTTPVAAAGKGGVAQQLSADSFSSSSSSSQTGVTICKHKLKITRVERSFVYASWMDFVEESTSRSETRRLFSKHTSINRRLGQSSS